VREVPQQRGRRRPKTSTRCEEKEWEETALSEYFLPINGRRECSVERAELPFYKKLVDLIWRNGPACKRTHRGKGWKKLKTREKKECFRSPRHR